MCADNIILSAGSGGSTVKTDDDGTAHWQYVKVAFGADNTQTRVTSTVGMPVLLLAGTAEIGKLAAGVAEIGNVKNSGTFATQATLTAETTKVIGTINVAAAQTIATTNAGTFAVQSTLQAGTASIGKLAANSGVDIGDVDVTSVITGTGATNLGKAIDSVAGATDTGVALLAVRDDALTTLTPVDGDYVGLRVNSTGALHVTGGGGGTQYAVDDANPTVVTMAGAVRDDALTTLTEIDGDATLLRVGSTGALHVNGSGFTQPVSGTITANAGTGTLAVSLASVPSHAVTNAGTFAVQSASTLAAETTKVIGTINIAAGQTTAVTNAGTFAVQSASTLAAETTKVIGTVNVAAAQTIATTNAGTFAVQAASAGDVAHDTADSGNPIKVGGKAYDFDGTVPGTAVVEADRTNFITDVFGRQFVETAHPYYWRASVDYASAQTNATIKAAAGAGLKLYITDVLISNGATAGNITLLDGSAGTVLLECYPAITGGLTMGFKTPLGLTANTLLAITSTTVTTHSVTVSGYIAP